MLRLVMWVRQLSSQLKQGVERVRNRHHRLTRVPGQEEVWWIESMDQLLAMHSLRRADGAGAMDR